MFFSMKRGTDERIAFNKIKSLFKCRLPVFFKFFRSNIFNYIHMSMLKV